MLRGLAHIEDMNGGRQRIVITEIPFLLNKSSLIERIAELAREERSSDISDLRDEVRPSRDEHHHRAATRGTTDESAEPAI